MASNYTNIILAVPHAVGDPLDCDWREDAKVAASARRWTDWHTDKLFSVKDGRIVVVKGRLSRFDCDDERLEHENDRLCRYALEGGIDLDGIGAKQWNARLAEWFWYRAELMSAAARGEHPLIIDSHSFPSDLAPDVDICIGFNEDGSKPSEETLAVVTRAFEAAGYKVACNNPLPWPKAFREGWREVWRLWAWLDSGGGRPEGRFAYRGHLVQDMLRTIWGWAVACAD